MKEIDCDDIKRFKQAVSKGAKLMGEHSPAIQAFVAIIQMVIAGVMVFALYQSCETIKSAKETLTIEQETRLNPELECGYNWVGGDFMLKNVGDADANVTVFYAEIYFVQTNQVQKFYYQPLNQIYPPVNPQLIPPGGLSYMVPKTVPDFKEAAVAWKKFGGDILIRLYINYERNTPTYRKYSGYYDFTMEGTILRLADNSPLPPTIFLLTEEEAPYLHKIVENFNATSEKQFFTASKGPGTNFYYLDAGLVRRYSSIVGATNASWVNGSWAKLH